MKTDNVVLQNLNLEVGMFCSWILFCTTGSSDKLDQYQVVVGGDQLTRVRLSGSQALRSLAPSGKSRFVHLSPIVFEQWHNKQDFVEVSCPLRFSNLNLIPASISFSLIFILVHVYMYIMRSALESQVLLQNKPRKPSIDSRWPQTFRKIIQTSLDLGPQRAGGGGEGGGWREWVIKVFATQHPTISMWRKVAKKVPEMARWPY